MKRPAIFFDRDNTLIHSDGYLGDPSVVKLVPGAADAVARARSMGFAVVICSNQSGVARGLFTEEAVQAVNRRMDQLLEEQNPNAIIDRHEYCPFHPDAKIEKYRQQSDLRKPGPGMIHRAAEAMELDLAESWVIGDAPRDIAAGQAAGCRTILVNDPALSPSVDAGAAASVEPDETVPSLSQALDVIEAAGALSSASAAARDHRHEAQRSEPRRDQRIDAPTPRELDRLEHLAQQILDQLHRRHRHPMDFSASKLLAGVTQVLAIAAAAGSYFYRSVGQGDPILPLLLAIFLQTLTISLLLLGRESH
jgi:D-glycero-D-manno-heptose 1,7-bisphosphate phosphatase